MNTKEMNVSEVNAVQATINHQNLLNRFNYLTKDMDDWKMPIKAVIPIKHLNEYREACEYFTGTELYVVSQVENEPYFNVAAKGYYMMGE